MTFRGFLKEKWLFLTCQTVMIAAVSILLFGLNFNISGIVFIGICWLLAMLVPLLWEYFKKRSYYKKLYDSLEKLDKKHLLVSVLEPPDFIEGEILYDVLSQTKKAMNDEVAAYRHLNEDYHDYVETWIHEIKIPISCIDLVCENNKNDVTNSIQEELVRIDRYVEQTLYYVRSLNVEKDYFVRKLSLEQIVKSAVKKYAKQLIVCNIQLQFDGLEKTVYGDSKWLDFILGQLISNSIKYKSDAPTLLFWAEENKDSVLLHVQDNGIGIPDSDINRVFDKGFTGQNGRNFTKSTGIGLYLCKQLCNKMYLNLYADSQAGIGTTMTIVFPKDSLTSFREDK
ncbi:Sensor histidine kinase graS [uncultured Ruminococcus sp.]|uniref:sensor histidine kinase n=1 Tax=Massiliimalia timonensis TaxID=1987501 RepID=UPI000820ABC2|nr:sensor histidine kinase [Massiliimalia timonensis]SCI16595.1 Sensor histidine kinase graS [uncultured Clostridium sp.]SCI40278.1 Sensor histidine kinase graS [uncultured Ruminococcus sp.]